MGYSPKGRTESDMTSDLAQETGQERWNLLQNFSLGGGFPGSSVVRNLPANIGNRGARDMGLMPDLGRSHIPWSN